MQGGKCLKATFQVAPNIALIKYWGKYDEELIIPINSSLSLTLSEEDFNTQTTVIFSKEHAKDLLILNEKETPINKRIQNVLDNIRSRLDPNTMTSLNIDISELDKWKFEIITRNNFPTAAGLASSSSGIACLVVCLTSLFQIKEIFPGEFSMIARIGSGSASRSIYGGCVEWKGIEKKYLWNDNISKEDLQRSSRECVAQQ